MSRVRQMAAPFAPALAAFFGRPFVALTDAQILVWLELGHRAGGVDLRADR